jgi:signal transduction histidine kinase
VTRVNAVRLVVGVLLLGAWYIDLQSHAPVASLYGVPILIAALLLPVRDVIVASVAAIFLNLTDAFAAPTAIDVLDLGSEVMVVIFAVLLARQKREMVEHRRDLQRFMGMVAHELRSPLTAVTLALELGRSMRAAERAAAQMRRLIDDLVDASRAGGAAFELRPAALDLVPVIAEVVERNRHGAPGREISLEAPRTLEGIWDGARLGQLTENLVSNALKYSAGPVRVSLRAEGNDAFLSVSDRGRGLTPAQLGHLFQPFSRLGEGAVSGTGLGLYIARAIVEAHGGRIWVDTRLGMGSTFHARVPRRRLGLKPRGID